MGIDESFDSFYAAQFQPLTLQLYAYTADVSLAQDAVQEAFTRAWPRWDTLLGYDNPAAWIRRVAMNVAMSRVAPDPGRSGARPLSGDVHRRPEPGSRRAGPRPRHAAGQAASGDRALPHRRPVGG